MGLECIKCNKFITRFSKSGFCVSCCKIGTKHPHTKETKKKISKATKLAMKRSNANKKISIALKGRRIPKATKIKMSFSKLGHKHWNWQGGISKLAHCLRNLEQNKNWIKRIFKRDNYTCQECGQYGGILEVHHIKSFQQIYKEFLKEYDQFSVIEDRETLIRLAFKYKPFWDINNGKTLCKSCHRL